MRRYICQESDEIKNISSLSLALVWSTRTALADLRAVRLELRLLADLHVEGEDHSELRLLPLTSPRGDQFVGGCAGARLRIENG